MAERIREINPEIQVHTINAFLLDDNTEAVLGDGGYDYIVDAVDTVTAKLSLILYARERNIPVISSMGTANKLDATKFEVVDISKTHTCPLARVMRKELRDRGIISGVEVLYSTALPVKIQTAADAEDGERIKQPTEGVPPRFQDVFGETLLEIARTNNKIVGVTPAMPTGCSMNIMMKAMPERTFDVGIAEGHAVTFSAGMAKEGMMPFCNIYSSFAQRAYDNIIHDAALLNLDMVICLDRAGLVGEDGPTHHGAYDLASLRAIPNLTIASPYDEHELRHLMYTAQLPGNGTFVIRYPRGGGKLVDWRCPFKQLEVGKGRMLKDGKDLAVISFGPIGVMAAEAIKDFEKAHPSLKIAHYDLRFLKPLDTAMLNEVASRFSKVITIEDGCLQGGMGSAIVENFSDSGAAVQVARIGIPDRFVEHGSVPELYHLCEMSKEHLLQKMQDLCLGDK
jgi:1-deoxy-D-xylulose-5-phosphate synthase